VENYFGVKNVLSKKFVKNAEIQVAPLENELRETRKTIHCET